jgi:hypothetical protein
MERKYRLDLERGQTFGAAAQQSTMRHALLSGDMNSRHFKPSR